MFKTVSYEKAVKLFGVMSFLRTCIFLLPVFSIFLKYKGVPTEDFFIFVGVFSVAGFLLEIPTGYLGDIFSRKKIIFFGVLSGLTMNLIWYFQDGLFWMAMAAIFDGLAMALLSGTKEAYLYDVLKKQNREKDFHKEMSNVHFLVSMAMGIACVAGGFMYSYFGPDKTVLFEALLVFTALILVLFLPDLDGKRVVEKGKSKWKDIVDITKYAVKHPEIKWLIIFPAFLGVGTYIMFWTLQPVMEAKLVPVALFGIIVAVVNFARAFYSKISHKLFVKLKTRNFTLLLFSILPIIFITMFSIFYFDSMVMIYLSILVLIFCIAGQALLKPMQSSMINHRIKSDERATVLSVASMAIAGVKGLILFSMKFLVGWFGLQWAVAVMGVIIIIPTFIAMKKLLKLKL